MPERENLKPSITGPETTDLDREAQPFGDGGQRDQLHPPVLGLEMFVEKLRGNKDQLLQQVNEFLRKANKTPEELALGIYLDVILKQDVFGIDPFASKQPGNHEVQADREAIAFMATEFIANNWLTEHSSSQNAATILECNIYSPRQNQLGFLSEMWPTILSKIDPGDPNGRPQTSPQ